MHVNVSMAGKIRAMLPLLGGNAAISAGSSCGSFYTAAAFRFAQAAVTRLPRGKAAYGGLPAREHRLCKASV